MNHTLLIALLLVIVVVAVVVIAALCWLGSTVPKTKPVDTPREPQPWPPPVCSDDANLVTRPTEPVVTNEIPPSTSKSELIESIARMVAPLCKPAVLVRVSETSTLSRFGGMPPCWPDFEWPYNGPYPMAHLFTLDVSELPNEHGLDFLLDRGAFSFFADLQHGGTGYTPEHSGFRVLYTPDDIAGSTGAMFPEGLLQEDRFARRDVCFELAMLPPDWETEGIGNLSLNDLQREAFWDYRASLYGGFRAHQIGGHVQAIQNPNMEVDCQMFIHGINVRPRDFLTQPQYAELTKGMSEWRLLLQIDDDPELQVSKGEGGILYFWIRREDAKAGLTDHCWMTFQCT